MIHHFEYNMSIFTSVIGLKHGDMEEDMRYLSNHNGAFGYKDVNDAGVEEIECQLINIEE